MPNNVIKFGKARKAIARKERENTAAENRIKHGMTKAEKCKLKVEQDKMTAKIDGHKRDNEDDAE